MHIHDDTLLEDLVAARRALNAAARARDWRAYYVAHCAVLALTWRRDVLNAESRHAALAAQ